MIKKTLFVGVIASCFAFTNGNFTLKSDLDYIETVNTLEDLQDNTTVIEIKATTKTTGYIIQNF